MPKYHIKIIYIIKVPYSKVNINDILDIQRGLPWRLRWLRICLQCSRPEFHLLIGKITWRRKEQPIPVFLPGEFHGQKSLVGYSPWGRKESGKTEWLTNIDIWRGYSICKYINLKLLILYFKIVIMSFKVLSWLVIYLYWWYCLCQSKYCSSLAHWSSHFITYFSEHS